MNRPGILHVDLDAFYASVEELDDPKLRGRPVVVGGLGGRGVIAAANYEARKYGIHSATPTSRARKLCPHGVFLAPRFERYAELSRTVMDVMRSYTPLVEPISLDEAFLDVRGAVRLHGDGPEIGHAIKMRVRMETGLVASVGVAMTKLLAKIASDLGKPDGFVVVEAGRELETMHPLPVQRLWGVGPATAKRLEGFGVTTIGDLARLPETTLVHALGPSLGPHLHELAWNRDPRPVVSEREAKSVGHEETFPRDLVSPEELGREVVRLAELVAGRLRRAQRRARTVQLKVRYPDFHTITRAATLAESVDTAAAISRAALELLRKVDIGPGVRLLGVAAQQLEELGSVQPPLFEDGVEEARSARRSAVERVVDRVRERFGTDSVGPATLVDRNGLQVRRSGNLWGPDEPEEEE